MRRCASNHAAQHGHCLPVAEDLDFDVARLLDSVRDRPAWLKWGAEPRREIVDSSPLFLHTHADAAAALCSSG
jgi:hypothetical protein